MKLENQVVSLELSKKLKELNVKKDSIFNWVSLRDSEWFISGTSLDLYVMKGRTEFYPAYTASELLELLPSPIEHPDEDDQTIHLIIEKDVGFSVRYIDIHEYYVEDELCTALAKMLIHLLESGLIKAEDLV